MGFLAVYFMIIFVSAGIGLFFILKENGLEPLSTVNKFMIYYVFVDLLFRYFLQKMPVMNIRPLLTLPIKRNTIVHFALGKTALSFFNWSHALFFIPFSIVLLMNGYAFLNVILWHLGIMALIYFNNFINILINNKDSVFYSVLAIVVVLGAAHYYQLYDITLYSQPFFQGMFETVFVFLIPIILVVATYYFAFNYFKSNLNLDEGLATKSDIAKTQNFTFLDQYGVLGTFLKNDLRLLMRNKRSKTTLLMSFLFIFYGFFFFNNPTQPAIMGIFAGVFVSGGFLFIFGQFVPSWDSAYYQLMMSQNIPYRQYIQSKWWLMVIGTIISTILASFYLFFNINT